MSDAYLRILGTSFRRYSADPSSRHNSARQMLGAALAIYAAEMSLGDAALIAAEYISALRQAERLSAPADAQQAHKQGG